MFRHPCLDPFLKIDPYIYIYIYIYCQIHIKLFFPKIVASPH